MKGILFQITAPERQHVSSVDTLHIFESGPRAHLRQSGHHVAPRQAEKRRPQSDSGLTQSWVRHDAIICATVRGNA